MLQEPLNLSYRDAQGVYRAIITRATLIEVASDESTPPDQLAAFAACEDIDVRRALANNRRRLLHLRSIPSRVILR